MRSSCSTTGTSRRFVRRVLSPPQQNRALLGRGRLLNRRGSRLAILPNQSLWTRRLSSQRRPIPEFRCQLSDLVAHLQRRVERFCVRNSGTRRGSGCGFDRTAYTPMPSCCPNYQPRTKSHSQLSASESFRCTMLEVQPSFGFSVQKPKLAPPFP